jgi:alpha-beta hydrolase superfamily lysophospholipase
MPEYTDAHGVTITYYEWSAPTPKAVVQIAHGLGEYAGRYTHVAEALVAAGYSVVADDHRGHGQTGLRQYDGDRSKLGRLGPGGLRATIDAVRQLSELTRGANPGVPLVLVGHSWGSLMAQILINQRTDLYAGVVLTGTAYRSPGSMNSGDLNRRHKHLGTTGSEWLSRDAAVAQAMSTDELAFPAAVLKLFGVADGLRLFGRPARGLSPDLPVLIQVGSDDPLGGERSALKLAQSYRQRSGLKDVQTLVYPEARHEVFNELNKDEVIADLIAWLGSRVAASTPRTGTGL